VIQIGVGGFGKSWLKTVLQEQEVELAAIVDVADENLEVAKQLLQGKVVPVFRDHHEALSKVKADAVMIITPPHTHMAIAFDVMKAGLHIFLEKPLTYSIEDAGEFVRKYQHYDKKVMINQNYRWMPEIQALKQAIAGGLIGDIGYIDYNFRRLHNSNVNTWRVHSGEFLFTDVSIHHFDLIRYFLECEPEYVTAQGIRPAWSWCEGITVGGAIFEFPKGVLMNYFGSLSDFGSSTTWNGDIRITGSEGAVELSHDVPYLTGKGGERQELPLPEMQYSSQGYSLHQFVHSVRHGTTPITDLSDNIKSHLMVHAVIQSIRSNRRVAYDDYFQALYK
jgi:predicted dehydrogenase